MRLKLLALPDSTTAPSNPHPSGVIFNPPPSFLIDLCPSFRPRRGLGSGDKVPVCLKDTPLGGIWGHSVGYGESSLLRPRSIHRSPSCQGGVDLAPPSPLGHAFLLLTDETAPCLGPSAISSGTGNLKRRCSAATACQRDSRTRKTISVLRPTTPMLRFPPRKQHDQSGLIGHEAPSHTVILHLEHARFMAAVGWWTAPW